MSGGGRRPPSTRHKSPAKDSRRSITPPARRNINGNAGYAAVVHGSHGRFSSKAAAAHGVGSPVLEHSMPTAVDALDLSNNVAEIASSKDSAMEVGVSTMHEVGNGCIQQLEAHGTCQVVHGSSLDISMEDGSQADQGSGNVCEQPHAMGIMAACNGDHGSGNILEQQHAMGNTSLDAHGTVCINDSMLLDMGKVAGSASNDLLAKDSCSRRQDVDMQNHDLPSPNGACGFATAQLQGRFVNAIDGSILNSHKIIDTDCQKAHSSSQDNISDVCMISGEDKIPILHEYGRQLNSMQGVRHNVSSKQPSCSAIPNVWKKQGVVPLPSMQELGNPPSLNGAAQLDDEEVKGYMDKFRSALVGRLFGRHFPFFHLNNELHRRWDGFGSFKLLTLSNDCFICFFDDVAARDAVLMAGPWIIAGQVVGLDIWTPSFSPSTMHGFVTPIWIRFPGLPLYCWGKNSLTRIASILGEPIWIDDATAVMSRASYARVCIRADLSKPLASSVRVFGLEGPFHQQVEYEGVASLCFKCGRVGHKDIKCPTYGSLSSKSKACTMGHSPQVVATPPTITPKLNHLSLDAVERTLKRDSPLALDQVVSNSLPAEVNNSNLSASGDVYMQQALKVSDDGFGPWMVVQRRRRKPAPPKQSKHKWIPSSRNNQGYSSVHISKPDKDVDCPPLKQPQSALLQTDQPHILKNDVDCPPLKQPQSALMQTDLAHVLNNVPEEGLIFKSSPSSLEMMDGIGGARLNSKGKIKSKAKGSIGKAMQVMYDAGPLIFECHKKRKPSIQSNGEDASSSAPG